MSYFIIIRGPLGIGKSSVAKELSEILNAEYISIDSIIEELGLDKVPETEECIPAKNFIKAEEYVLLKVKKRLDDGKIIVFDGNFYHKEQIEHLLNNLWDYEHYIFTLKASLKVCIERDKQRTKLYGILAATAVHNLVSRFDYGIIINTENKNLLQVVEEILSYLPKPMRTKKL
ncbi:AAA family ATPase [Candidatus Woesearchaeota archaeon]|nr:AAA family ATPase [Candidatus Woesearchaeota archaeon]